MVVNVAADYWKAGQVGFDKGCADLGIPPQVHLLRPAERPLTEQNSELERWLQGISGY